MSWRERLAAIWCAHREIPLSWDAKYIPRPINFLKQKPWTRVARESLVE